MHFEFGQDWLPKRIRYYPLPTRPSCKAYSCSVTVPQRWQRNERSQWAYQWRAANDIFPARGMNLSRFLGRFRFQGGCLCPQFGGSSTTFPSRQI